MAYGVRTLWSRSCRSRLRTGKPSPRAEKPTGEGQQVASGAGREVRERRRAGTIRHRTRWQLESRMMRKYPVRFGGGRLEKGRATGTSPAAYPTTFVRRPTAPILKRTTIPLLS